MHVEGHGNLKKESNLLVSLKSQNMINPILVFFYSVFQGTLDICGASGILFINKNHHVSFKDAIDQGTNNRAKLFALVAS